MANALLRLGRIKTTLAEGNLPRYGQLNSIPEQLDTLRTRDWRLPGLPRVVLRVLVHTSTGIASASTKWCAGTCARMGAVLRTLYVIMVLVQPMEHKPRSFVSGAGWSAVCLVTLVSCTKLKCLISVSSHAQHLWLWTTPRCRGDHD